MKFILLREAETGSGVFALTTEVVEADAAKAATTCAERQVAENTRFALLPYDAMVPTAAPRRAAQKAAAAASEASAQS
jgi:hypothetical protein